MCVCVWVWVGGDGGWGKVDYIRGVCTAGIRTPVLIRKWTDCIFNVPPLPLPFLPQTCYVQVKIVLQLVPDMLPIASENMKQNVCMYAGGRRSQVDPGTVGKHSCWARRLTGLLTIRLAAIS